MTLKTLENYISFVMNIVKTTNYSQSLTSFKNSWNSYLSYRNVQPQSATNNHQMNIALNQVESQRKVLIDGAQRINSELKKQPNLGLTNNFDPFFGSSFIQFISQINQTNIDIEFSKLNDLVTQFQYLNQLGTTIKALNVQLTTADIEANNLLEVTFSGEASIKTLKEFSKHSDKFNQIFNMIGRVAQETDTNISIESVEKGSLILIVGAVTSLVVIVCKAIDKIQNVMLKHIDIQRKTFELRKLHVDGFDDILKKLDEQAKINLTKESDLISDSLLTEYGWKETDDLYNETKNATKKAVRALIAFTNKGGSLKGYLKEPDEQQKEILRIVNKKNNQIIAMRKQIAELTEGKQTLLIEYLQADEDDEKDTTDGEKKNTDKQ